MPPCSRKPGCVCSLAVMIINVHFKHKLVPRVVCEPLFQSSSQKTTLAQGSILREYFQMPIIRFEDRTHPSSLSFHHFIFLKGGKIF